MKEVQYANSAQTSLNHRLKYLSPGVMPDFGIFIETGLTMLLDPIPR
jgi:hypothetical protein